MSDEQSSAIEVIDDAEDTLIDVPIEVVLDPPDLKDRGDAISFHIDFQSDRDPGHKNIVEAIRDTNDSISQVRMEKRNRDRWLYLCVNDEPAEFAANFFRLPGQPTREGYNAFGIRTIAVWNREGEPDCEPDFR